MARKITKTSKTTSQPKIIAKSEVSAIPEKKVTSNAAYQKMSPTLKLKKSYIILGVIIIVLAILLYVFRGLFIAATVNGEPISRLTVINSLEQQGGKQALNTLVTKTLIEQEAQKEHVTVSQAEIDSEMKTIESNVTGQGQKLDDVLKSQGMTRQTLEDQVRLQKLVEKMVGKNITVSAKEVTDYMNKNKGMPGMTKANVEQQLYQQKLTPKVQSWIADLQKNAKINYYVSY